MKPVFKIALKIFGFNVLSLLLLFADLTGLILIVFSVFIQFIAALVMILIDENRLIGQGILLGVGIFSLVGFSVCTIAIQVQNIF